MSLDPAYKMIDRSQGKIEKWVLRRAFDVIADVQEQRAKRGLFGERSIPNASSSSHPDAVPSPFPSPSPAAALAQAEPPFLPDCILWRQKEQFSDGVGYKYGIQFLFEGFVFGLSAVVGPFSLFWSFLSFF